MGSSVYFSFLLPSLQTGRMSLKTTVFLCLVLVGFIGETWGDIQENPYAPWFFKKRSIEDFEDYDNTEEDMSGDESSVRSTDGDDQPNVTGVNADDTNNDDSEGSGEDGEQGDAMENGERKKRSCRAGSRWMGCIGVN